MMNNSERTSAFRFMSKKIISITLLIVMAVSAAGCLKRINTKNQENAKGDTKEQVTILVAAASSMEPSLEQIKTLFQKEYTGITLKGTYDSSGKLQTQIEQGMDADIFISAAMKQMSTLKDKGLVDKDSISELLENKVVLIVPKNSKGNITGFDNILNAKQIAIGDPVSVPAGQYAKEVFDNLGIYSKVMERASLGTNVTEVLNWVSEGSADAGVVYATDAASSNKVTIVEEAPHGSLKQQVIYPIGIVSTSKKKEAAKLYINYLKSEEAKKTFKKYGFVAK